MLPFPLRGLISSKVRQGIKKALYLQGMGRHTPEEVLEIARRDLDALSALLDNKPYFLGVRPTTLDAVAYGFLAEAIFPRLDSPMNALTKSYANLVAFCERVKDRYYAL
jgi:glutathione S-transferase